MTATALALSAPYWEETVAQERTAAVARSLIEAGYLPHIEGERAGWHRTWTDGNGTVHLEYRTADGRNSVLDRDDAWKADAQACADCAEGDFAQRHAVADWATALEAAGWQAHTWESRPYIHAYGPYSRHASCRRGVSIDVPRESRTATSDQYAVTVTEADGRQRHTRYTREQAQSILSGAHRRGLLVGRSANGLMTIRRPSGSTLVLEVAAPGHVARSAPAMVTVDEVCGVLRAAGWSDAYADALITQEGDDVRITAQKTGSTPAERISSACRVHEEMRRYAVALHDAGLVVHTKSYTGQDPADPFEGKHYVQRYSYTGELRVSRR